MKTPLILLVEDSTLFRMALTNTFSRNLGIRLVVCRSSSMPKKLHSNSVDVVVIDAVTWSAGQRNLRRAVETWSPVSPVILLGRDDLLEEHLQALLAGAAGFVSQTASARVFLKAIRAVSDGEVWFERKLFQEIFVQEHSVNLWRHGVNINSREQQILNHLATGKTNKEIGNCLQLGERTVKAYVSNLFRKTGASSRSALTSLAIRYGLAQRMRTELN